MFLIYIIFLFVHLFFYSMETVDNSFLSNNGSLVKNQVNIQYSTATGQCGRLNQEDRIAVNNESDLFFSLGVFDGHCGSQIAEILADQTNGLLNALHKKALLNKETIKKVYTEYDKSIERSRNTGVSGSTAVTVTVDVMRKQLSLAHCGDSIGVLIENKKILYWTVPHDTHIQTEVARIRGARGIVYGGRVNNNLNVTRSFGDYDICGKDYDNHCFPQLIISDPEVFETRLKPEKPVIGLLCSDGFTDYFCSGMQDFSSQNIQEKLLEPLSTIICKLIQCGRPISGLAFDLVCLMNWNKSVNTILESIKKDMDWETIKNESSSWKSRDNVSVVVFEIAHSNEESNVQIEKPEESLVIQESYDVDDLSVLNSHNTITPDPIMQQSNFHTDSTDNFTIVQACEYKFIGCFEYQFYKDGIFPGFVLEYQIMTNKNQDCVATKITNQANNKQWSCGVFDGHGGDHVSQKLANLNTGLFAEFSKKNNLNEEIIKTIYTEFDAQFKSFVDEGSTAVTCTFDPNQKKIFVAHCGDSNCLLIKDKIIHHTSPHDCNNILDLMEIQKNGGTIVNMGNVVKILSSTNSQLSVTRSFGDYQFVNNKGEKVIIGEPEVLEIKVESEPIIGILCSDGFSDYFFKEIDFDLAPKDIEVDFFKPFSLVINELIKAGRLDTLACDLVCLMGKYTKTDLLQAIKNKKINWELLKTETQNKSKSDYLDDVSIIIFKITPDNQNDDNNINTVKDSNNLSVGQDSNVDNSQPYKVPEDDQPSKKVKNLSLFSRIFNYARSCISFKGMCLGTFGFCLTAYIVNKLFRFKNI